MEDILSKIPKSQDAVMYIFNLGKEAGIKELCDMFKADWDEQTKNGVEDSINWYDWLMASANLIKEKS